MLMTEDYPRSPSSANASRWRRLEHPPKFCKLGLGDPNSCEPLLPPGLCAVSLAELYSIAVAPFGVARGMARMSFVIAKVSPRDVDLGSRAARRAAAHRRSRVMGGG